MVTTFNGMQDLDLQTLASGVLMTSPAPGFAAAAESCSAPPAQHARQHRHHHHVAEQHVEKEAHPIFLAPDPPKIRVIVRKRPLNRKVGMIGSRQSVV